VNPKVAKVLRDAAQAADNDDVRRVLKLVSRIPKLAAERRRRLPGWFVVGEVVEAHRFLAEVGLKYRVVNVVEHPLKKGLMRAYMIRLDPDGLSTDKFFCFFWSGYDPFPCRRVKIVETLLSCRRTRRA
jgi:hypothetical protein